MGKSARVREERREQREAEKVALAERELKIKRWRRVRPFVIAAVAVIAAVFIAFGVFFGIIIKQPFYLRKTVMMETENYKINGQMMAYYIYSTYQTYYQQYGSNIGLEEGVSFKKQKFDEGVTWFDYFNLESQVNMRQVLLFAEKAKQQGITLTEDEQKAFDESMAQADVSAYAEAFGMTLDDLKEALYLTNIASKMYQQAEKEMQFTDEEIKTYFEENKKHFQTIDYTLLSIPYGENGWYQNAEGAKSAANILQQATDVEMFESYVLQLLKAIGASEEDAETTLENGKMKGAYYTDNAFFNWAFEAARKVGNIYVEDTGSSYDVYLLNALPTMPQADMRNVRHILLSAETCETDEKAKAKAEEVLKEWKAGAKDAASFGELAKKYTEDTGSAEAGGLYENVTEGEMIDEFNDWLFDKSRKEGDTEIVKTDYGYHVMYYAGAGQELWETNAESSLINKKVNELCTEYEKEWPVTVHSKRINRLPL